MKKVAIVGLPNSGKSTLFNRLTGRRRALVHREAGMTRDRLYGVVETEGCEFLVIDTGGVAEAHDELQRAIQRQVGLALAESDLVVVLLDGNEGLRPPDVDLVRGIRKRKPFIVAVNKMDSDARELKLAGFAELGVETLAVSAMHGRGVDELVARILQSLPEEPRAEVAVSDAVTIAIVGRPNSGKSTLLNRLLGYERASVSALPGTTRDCVDAELESHGQRFRILDTAGIRRKTKIDDSQEIIAVIAARNTIPRADCTVLMLDSAGGISAHDRYLASEASDHARSVLVVVNKIDLAPSFNRARAEKQVHDAMKELPWARVLFISALTGYGTDRILKAVKELVAEGSRELRTADLNRFLESFFEMRSPLFADGRQCAIKYGVQIGRLPACVQLFAKRKTQFQPAYRKMLENHIRRRFGLLHSPVRIVLKADIRRSE
ncbi:MAG: ribosome biogenesis GTPase Der [Acidobacteriota bacterium]